jgi:hypothetical protein
MPWCSVKSTGTKLTFYFTVIQMTALCELYLMLSVRVLFVRLATWLMIVLAAIDLNNNGLVF